MTELTLRYVNLYSGEKRQVRIEPREDGPGHRFHDRRWDEDEGWVPGGDKLIESLEIELEVSSDASE